MFPPGNAHLDLALHRCLGSLLAPARVRWEELVDASWAYRLNPAVAIEDFDERSLALHCTDLRLIELNATARDLLARLDGQTTLREVAAALAADYGQSEEAVRQDVLGIIARMLDLGLVEPVPAPGPA